MKSASRAREAIVNAETAVSPSQLHHKLSALGQQSYTLEACERYAGLIAEIRALKAERRAVVLA